jgi:hypothetical protein
MPLMLVVLLVLTVVTVTLIGTGSRDLRSSRVASARTEGRLLASSVLEDFYARVRANPQGVFEVLAASNPQGLVGTEFANYRALSFADSTPWSLLPTPSRVTTDPATSNTLYGKPIGTESCPVDLSRDCFYVAVLDKSGNVSRPAAFTLQVNLRLRCDGVDARCVFLSFEQRLRRVQFYDFVLANEFSTLAPEALFEPGSWKTDAANKAMFDTYTSRCSVAASSRATAAGSTTVETGTTNYKIGTQEAGEFNHSPGSAITELPACIDIAYQGDDILGDDSLGAPIYSGDEYLTVCGTPKFRQVFLAGKGSQDDNKWFKVSGSCDLPVDTSPLRNIPHQLNFSVMELPTLTQKASQDAQLASPQSACQGGGPVCIDLGALRPEDRGVVITGDGNPGTLDAVVYGTVKGHKSVVVLNGSVAIIGDIMYDEPVSGGNSKNSFSLTASERIEIWQSCGEAKEHPSWPADFAVLWDPTSRCVPEDPSSSTAFSRTVHGILTSPDGFIGVPDWLTNVDQQRTQGKLKFFGSMAAKYQGVFGSFDADGKLVSGFAKDFTHDTRFTQFVNGAAPGPDTFGDNFALPPFVVESEVPVWLRLDLSEVGYQGP